MTDGTDAAIPATKPVPLGRTVHLDTGRLVFLGQVEGDENTYYIGFRNERDDATRLVLSREAFDALVWLRDNLDVPLKETFPTRRRDVLVWRIADQLTKLQDD